MTTALAEPTPEDDYLARVRAGSTVYGTVGALSDDEKARVLTLFANGVHHREAVREVLRMRGQWPGEPDPRRVYPVRSSVPGLVPTDHFGRPGGRSH